MHVNCPSHFALHYSMQPAFIPTTTPESYSDSRDNTRDFDHYLSHHRNLSNYVSVFVSKVIVVSICPFVSIPIPIHWLFENYFTHLNWYFLDLSLNQLFCSLSRSFVLWKYLQAYSFNVCQLILKRTTFVFWCLPLLLMFALLTGPGRGLMSPILFFRCLFEFLILRINVLCLKCKCNVTKTDCIVMNFCNFYTSSSFLFVFLLVRNSY